MRLRRYEITACVFVLLSCFNTRAQIGELYGNVKAVYENEYDAKDSAGLVVKNENRPRAWCYYTYNKQGKVLVKTDNHDGNGFVKKEVYRYDNKGREVEHDSYVTDTVNYPFASFTKYRRGKIVEQDSYVRYSRGWSETHPYYADKTRYILNFWGKTKKQINIHFSENGDSTAKEYDFYSLIQKVKETRIDTAGSQYGGYTIKYYYKWKDTCDVMIYSGQVTQKTVSMYNEKGLLIERTTIGIKDKSLSKREVFKYDKLGHEVEYAGYANDDTLPFCEIVDKYNAKNEITLSERVNYNKGKVTEDHKQVYEYDDKWNLIRMVVYGNGIPFDLTERKIYYW